jgi:DNA-binding CsgD family transcriptional regulator
MRQAKGARGRRVSRMSKEDLATRERAIIEDIKGGVLSYREIAQKHGVSLPTVNNKARKAGISRGRRKGARIVVARARRRAGVRRAVGKAVVRKAARKAVRRGLVRKAVRRRVVGAALRRRVVGAALRRRVVGAALRRRVVGGALRRRAKAAAAGPLLMAVARRRGRPPGRRGPGRPRGSRNATVGFAEALRMLVLQHFPNMSLQTFDRLSRLIEARVR